jgi:shikimate dehydrogenase
VLAKRRLAVIGHPVAHSRSPAIHNAAFAALGLADEWAYEAIDVLPEEFVDRARALPSEGFVGANVTVPHKRAALALADTASDAAGEIAAANTLSFARGAIGADNTDAPGFLAALPSSPSGRRALVLGAGGSARAVVWALAREGAKVEVWNRTAARADELGRELGASPLHAEGELSSRDFDLIVNATSVGMERPEKSGGRSGNQGSDLDALHLTADGLHDAQVIVDLVYGSAETQLIRTARERGASVVDGLEVLVRQGAASFRIWTGIDPPLDVMRRAAREAKTGRG